MFKPSKKKLGVFAMVSMLCIAAAVPAMSAGKTTKKMTCIIQGDPKAGLDVTATISCPKPMGKGKQTGKLVLPHARGKWTMKGGSFKWYTTSTVDGGTVKGTVSLTKGTGKFKGCSLKGTQLGPLSTAKIIYKLTYTCKK